MVGIYRKIQMSWQKNQDKTNQANKIIMIEIRRFINQFDIREAQE